MSASWGGHPSCSGAEAAKIPWPVLIQVKVRFRHLPCSEGASLVSVTFICNKTERSASSSEVTLLISQGVSSRSVHRMISAESVEFCSPVLSCHCSTPIPQVLQLQPVVQLTVPPALASEVCDGLVRWWKARAL